MSSLRRLRRNRCGSKRAFLTLSEARTAAWEINRAKTRLCGRYIDRKSLTLHPYCCNFCGRYHLGH